MDRKYVVDHDIVSRYLRGELSHDEAQAFEAFYLSDPETQDEIDMLLALQDAGPEAFRAEQSRPGSAGGETGWLQHFFAPARAPFHLAAYASLLVALCLSLLLNRPGNGLSEVTVLTLSTTRSGTADVALDTRAGRQPLMLAIPVPLLSDALFTLTVSQGDLTRLQLQGLTPDGSGTVNALIPEGVLDPGTWQIELRGSDGTTHNWSVRVGD